MSRDLRIEGRPVVHEVNAGRRSLVAQHESGVRSVRGRPTRPAIQSHREQQRCQKRHGDDGAPNGGARSVKHGESIGSAHHGGDTRPLHDARVVLPQVALVLRVGRVRLPRSVRIRLHAMERKRAHRRAERRVQIGVLDPPVGVEQEVALPARRQRLRGSCVELNGRLVARAHDHVHVVGISEQRQHVTEPREGAGDWSPR